jgi:hypothetical protein
VPVPVPHADPAKPPPPAGARRASIQIQRVDGGQGPLGRGGAFTIPNLQLGSDGETTSEWHPVLLGGDTDAACTLLVDGRKATGEYTGPWPAPGVSVLYRGGPVPRAV